MLEELILLVSLLFRNLFGVEIAWLVGFGFVGLFCVLFQQISIDTFVSYVVVQHCLAYLRTYICRPN